MAAAVTAALRNWMRIVVEQADIDFGAVIEDENLGPGSTVVVGFEGRFGEADIAAEAVTVGGSEHRCSHAEEVIVDESE